MSWFVYVIRLFTNNGDELRDRVIQKLTQQGIQCGRYFAPIHQQPAYAAARNIQHLPVTEQESRRTIALPFFTALSAEQIARVAASLLRAIEASG
jgi:perosamine synthetase